MNDIDTIREALENCLQYAGDIEQSDSVALLKTALSALERVSALQAEMEAVLEMCGSLCEELESVSWFPESDFGMKEVRPTQEAVLAIIRPKESR